jgi:Fe-S-cluster-containing dehydrogenase component
MTDYYAIVDVSKCVDCRACVIQCKDEYALNDYLPYSAGMTFRGQKWIRIETLERGKFPKPKWSSIPVLCMQCDNAPCVTAAKDGAVYKRPDGIVIIDPVKSKGQKQLVNSCPYGLIHYNDEKDIPQKCTFCIHRLEKGLVPRCVQACPGNAIKIGDWGQLLGAGSSLAGAAGVGKPETFHPEYKTGPNRVNYVGLPKTFVTGCLIDSKGECLADAAVALRDTDAKGQIGNMSTNSDFLGDFWFDGLDAKRTYELTFSKAGKTKTLSVTPDTDTDLGDIVF